MGDTRPNPDDHFAGIEFESIALRPRRRGVDRLGIGAIVIAVGLAAAMVKPWSWSSSTPLIEASVRPATSQAPAPASDRAAQADPPTQAFVPSPTRILAAIERHDDWGVLAVVRGRALPGDPDGPAYTERWARAVERDDGSRLALLGTGDESVVALGVTAPASETPIDIRVLRPTEAGDWERLDVRPLTPDPPAGEVLLKPPTNDPLAPETWPAGAYRIELVLGRHVGVIDVRLPGRFDRVPQPPPASLPPPD